LHGARPVAEPTQKLYQAPDFRFVIRGKREGAPSPMSRSHGFATGLLPPGQGTSRPDRATSQPDPLLFQPALELAAA
jgi:hypothetical protein